MKSKLLNNNGVGTTSTTSDQALSKPLIGSVITTNAQPANPSADNSGYLFSLSDNNNGLSLDSPTAASNPLSSPFYQASPISLTTSTSSVKPTTTISASSTPIATTVAPALTNQNTATTVNSVYSSSPKYFPTSTPVTATTPSSTIASPTSTYSPAVSSANIYQPSQSSSSTTYFPRSTYSIGTYYDPSSAFRQSVLASLQQELRAAGINSIINSNGQSLAIQGQIRPSFAQYNGYATRPNIVYIPMSSNGIGTTTYTTPSVLRLNNNNSVTAVGGSTTAVGGNGQNGVAVGKSVTAVGQTQN
jgi:hypothetical protein